MTYRYLRQRFRKEFSGQAKTSQGLWSKSWGFRKGTITPYFVEGVNIRMYYVRGVCRASAILHGDRLLTPGISVWHTAYELQMDSYPVLAVPVQYTLEVDGGVKHDRIY